MSDLSSVSVPAGGVVIITNEVSHGGTEYLGVTPSADDTVILAGSSGSITDASGNVWTIAAGVVDENGQAAGYSENVSELAYVNGTIWQENTSNLWWEWNGSTWPGGGSAVSPLPCFAAATHILAAKGEVPVEALDLGDRVPTQGGVLASIVWIGRRHIVFRRHRHSKAGYPVRIRVGAFGDNVPHRDLYLSPDHAAFIDGTLVPVRYLVNGSTIAPVEVDEITYYHLELADHHVLLAEGPGLRELSRYREPLVFRACGRAAVATSDRRRECRTLLRSIPATDCRRHLTAPAPGS